ncbi:glycoside hydrolase family 2 TIM barrel-domain containing protein [Cellulomonas humilata]|uniref:Beta-galactosidase n=1 Tax=Cellulomonas humilata TaxID=144055 RepID=A0ABU0EE84_9CELL|nr:glycoside hydrolase family 2 TIM barrel-domain containing protein [Cellulomonas humilata]MDQ0373375.1 beta-galactosidase [Cellulomonas humilata]
MTFDLDRIADPALVQENRLDAHSDHRWFASSQEAATGTSSFEQSLNGLWKLHYAKSPALVVPGFERVDVDDSGWDDVPVPAHIQLLGYDRPQYTNVQYPWDGYEQLEAGQVPQRYNPVATYRRTFALEHPLEPGERLSVSFHGAESAVAVWLNGAYIGYGTDSFTPSEFDLTDALVDGENVIVAQVVRWSAGSWIEDQDFFRFSGLFRDVVLYRRPTVHVEDVRVVTDVADDLSEATVRVRIVLAGDGRVDAGIAGAGQLTGDDELVVRIESPRLWSAEDPHRYDLTLDVYDSSGRLTEHVPVQVGVRRFGIEDGLLKVNGSRVVFNGVNRHDFGLQGRVMTRAQTEADVQLMKRLNINAVRTSHYPNNSYFYDLCDEYGLYVIDEMNLESHGMWDLVRFAGAGIDVALPGDRPEWLPTLLDRAASMLERDKNHPSVVMWSCGNESFGGSNILEVSEYFRREDSRPVHYEGVHWDPRHPQTTDVVSRMYAPAAEIEEFLATHRDKPYVLCEYAHAMGNSFGAVHKYVDLAYREPLFQGGFIWDFADQALRRTDPGGREYFGYGGDFGDAPHDGDFSGNGIVFADRSLKPLAQEVRYLYQGYRLSVGSDKVTVENRHLATSSSAHECVVTVAREGRVLQEEVLETDVAPGGSQVYALPVTVPSGPGEYTVDVSFRLRRTTRWASAGHEVAHEQTVVVVPTTTPARRAAAPEVVYGIHNVGVRGRHFTALFSRLHGGLQSYRYGLTGDGGRELLRSVPRPSFWHAPTSNERGWGAPALDGGWLIASRYATAVRGADHPAVEQTDAGVLVSFRYELPTAPAGECELSYLVDGDGRVEVTLTVRPGAGLPDMPELGLLLATDPAFRNLRWYGDGPEESYVDRRAGARLGVWDADVRTALTPYLRPQEAGSRTGVRWATVTDEQGAGLRLESDQGMELSALPWTPFEIENAAHHTELPPIYQTVLRPALQRRGVGGDDSWGAQTHPEYRLPTETELTFRFAFRGLL